MLNNYIKFAQGSYFKENKSFFIVLYAFLDIDLCRLKTKNLRLR